MREPHASGHVPRNWGEAFTALPPEAPPGDALQRVFARAPAQRPVHRRSLRLPLAIAASLLALACVPLLWRALPPDPTARPFASRPTTVLATPRPAVIAAVQTASTTATSPIIDDTKPANDAATPPQSHTTPARVAKADRPRHSRPRRGKHATPAADPPDALEPLYAESARLEALLALARDDRVSSATAVALGSDLEARVAGIDAALAQPSLDAHRRLGLWRERVSALRAYASFESTQRALAASGERYDAMLVSID